MEPETVSLSSAARVCAAAFGPSLTSLSPNSASSFSAGQSAWFSTISNANNASSHATDILKACLPTPKRTIDDHGMITFSSVFCMHACMPKQSARPGMLMIPKPLVLTLRDHCHTTRAGRHTKRQPSPVVSDPPPTTANGDARAIWPSPRRQASGKGYLGPLAPMPVKSYRAEYSHSSRNSCKKDNTAFVNSCLRLIALATTKKSHYQIQPLPEQNVSTWVQDCCVLFCMFCALSCMFYPGIYPAVKHAQHFAAAKTKTPLMQSTLILLASSSCRTCRMSKLLLWAL